mmetsp:Transcript_929/g.2162  ORF Transcript_929/g.2162 Transcript_929/m.2162 type:complete len:166 (-) Transcript_929:838-1335(-)
MADNASPQPPSAAATSPNMASSAPKQSALEQFRKQYKYVQPNGKKPSPLRTPMQQPSNFHLFVKAGLPFLLFSVGASYVLKSAVEGKNLERDKSKGLISKSERQARLDAEKDNMMEKLNKKLKTEEFDNTKRIERPEEILERRKKEREDRNKWYKRTWRWITWQQ